MTQLFVRLPSYPKLFSFHVDDYTDDDSWTVKNELFERFSIPWNLLNMLSFQSHHGGQFLEGICRVKGGKGGFGSQLRAQGGRMSSRKVTNKESCRDLSGRRLRNVNQSKVLAEYLSKEPERQKAETDKKKRRMEAIVKNSVVSEDDDQSPVVKKSDEGKSKRLKGSGQEIKEKEKHLVKIEEFVEEAIASSSLSGSKKGKAPVVLKSKWSNLPDLSSSDSEH
jgi:hypothetical protein